MKRSTIAAVLATTAGHFLLAEGDAAPGRVRFLSQAVQLADGATQTWVTLTRTGNFSDPRYGQFAITGDMLATMVRNFDSRVLGQDVFIDVSHKPSDGAAGKVLKLSVEGGRLRALVEWTPFGVDAIKQRGFAYLSAEYHEAWVDNEKQQPHGCVLLGAGLTVRPVIKGLESVQLSEDHDAVPVRTAISPSLFKELSEHSMNKFLQALLARLITLGYSEASAKPLLDAAGAQITAAAADEAKCLAVVDSFAAAGETAMLQVKAAGGDPKTVTIQLAAPVAPAAQPDLAGLVATAVQKALSDAAAVNVASTTAMAGKLKLLSDTIADGDKTLTPEGVKKFADDYTPLVTAVTTDEQVKHLASLAVNQAKALSAAQKLVGLGYNPASGHVHITVDSSNTIKSLQSEIDRRLGYTSEADSKRFYGTGGKLLAANKDFAEKALAQYDSYQNNGARLADEHKMLAGGTSNISDIKVPAIVERTVIREALYNLVSLNFVDVGVAGFAPSISIPYSYRDTTAAKTQNTRRYEGQGILRGGVIQTADTAYITPQKLAMLVTNEVRYLMGNAPIDFDPISENIRNLVRIIGEDTEAINCNEICRAADEFGATVVSGELLTASVNGTNKVFPLANFPVVRPRTEYDLQGNVVVATTNPITVLLNALARTEYLLPADGSALSAGVYWTMDYNLGELRFVDQTGAAFTPTSAWVLNVSYSYSTNASKFSTDLGVLTTGQLYDNLLVAIGGRKVVIGNDRFYNPSMVMMSMGVDNMLSQATGFTANGKRNGSELNADGSVGITKGIATFNPTAPGLQMGDTRIVVAEKGNTRFRMVKPFSMSELTEARNTTGLFIGAREAYGEQYIVSKTPVNRKNAATSVILFSATGRVARVS